MGVAVADGTYRTGRLENTATFNGHGENRIPFAVGITDGRTVFNDDRLYTVSLFRETVAADGRGLFKDDGRFLGIGRGDSWSDFKVEVYEETENGVRSICSYEIDNAEYSTEYKSYYVDRQNQLVGIGITDNRYYNQASRYILLHFDGYELVELVNVPLSGNPTNMRGVYIDGYMYMFGQNDFKVKKVFN